MAGKCPECGVLVEAENPPALAALIVEHRCDPDLWLAQQESARIRAEQPVQLDIRIGGRRGGKNPAVAIERLQLELDRTKRTLRAAWLIVAVEGLALFVNAILWLVAR